MVKTFQRESQDQQKMGIEERERGRGGIRKSLVRRGKEKGIELGQPVLPAGLGLADAAAQQGAENPRLVKRRHF